MTHTPATFAEALLALADDCGCIHWIQARRVAIAHGLFDDFRTDYDHLTAVNVAEFLAWLGY